MRGGGWVGRGRVVKKIIWVKSKCEPHVFIVINPIRGKTES